MAQGEFTKEEAKSVEDAVCEMHKALSKAKQAEYLGHLNDILLFIAAAKQHASPGATEEVAPMTEDQQQEDQTN